MSHINQKIHEDYFPQGPGAISNAPKYQVKAKRYNSKYVKIFSDSRATLYDSRLS